MPGLLIKELPAEVHQKLKARAAKNRRSMTKEALYLLETALLEEKPQRPELPEPLQGNFPLTNEWIDKAKREGGTGMIVADTNLISNYSGDSHFS